MDWKRFAGAAAICLLASGALAEEKATVYAQPKDKHDAPEPVTGGSKSARDIISQPVRDVGIAKTTIPPVLVAAAKDPYSLRGLKTCRQLSAAVKELNAVLGPDFESGPHAPENRTVKLAEAGGSAVVNSLIPFRGLVREVSGAAPAERSLNAAVDAGLARRGFLRGVHRRQGCKTAF
jgi:hypothetical protein